MRTPPLAPVIASLVLLLVPAASVFAHEHRQVGAYEMIVGWVEEPAYVGFKNGIQVQINDHSGKPFLDLGDALRVEVIYGRERAEPVPVIPAFGAKSGRAGEYRAPIIPTRAGAYTFRFVGQIKSQKVDESFIASEATFDLVREASEIEFPAKDPTRAELALRIQRMGPRIDKIRKDLDGVKALASVGLAVGIAGLVAAIAVARSRRPQ